MEITKFCHNNIDYTIQNNLILKDGYELEYAQLCEKILFEEFKGETPASNSTIDAFQWFHTPFESTQSLSKKQVEEIINYYGSRIGPYIILLKLKPEQFTETLLEVIISKFTNPGLDYAFLKFVPDHALTKKIIDTIVRKVPLAYCHLPNKCKTKEISREFLRASPQLSYFIPPELRPELVEEVFGVKMKPEIPDSKEVICEKLNDLSQEDLIQVLTMVTNKLSSKSD